MVFKWPLEHIAHVYVFLFWFNSVKVKKTTKKNKSAEKLRKKRYIFNDYSTISEPIQSKNIPTGPLSYNDHVNTNLFWFNFKIVQKLQNLVFS